LQDYPTNQIWSPPPEAASWRCRRPTVAEGGFHEFWDSDEPDWARIMVTAEESPRIKPKHLEEARRTLPEWWFRQEYLCEFMEADTAALSTGEIQRAFSERSRRGP
jgi:hypothetical protein